jgi:hypothetical protein
LKYEGKPFQRERVVLDGNEYDKCTFDLCELVYSGGPPPSFSNCSFTNFRIVFDGPAASTVAFLKAMSMPNSGMQSIVRDTFPDLVSR